MESKKKKKIYWALAIALLFLIVIAGNYVLKSKTVCNTDFNADGVTDLLDQNYLLKQYGRKCENTPCSTDLNNDGITNSSDLGLFIASIGKKCK